MYMHGRVKKEGEDRLFPQKITSRATGFVQHMQSVPSPTPTRISVEGKSNSLVVSTATDTASSFSKDGRKISVGDCALFKPPHDSPPFIGVICSLVFSEDKPLQLGVTWLYRPSEVKLGKGFFLDAAPNEIFYSFHKDEKIPAAALLHPCKVAFLPKGIELPKGISSFVCRRVYDIENECLWWLTDKDYLDERQEEVNKLLNRTQKEMEQAGGCSPTETSAASHLKSASDNNNLQNSVTSVPSQLKGVKKRDRSDLSSDHVKREHPSKADDGDSGTPRSHVKREHPSKADDGDSGTPRSHVKREHPSKADDGDSGTPRSHVKREHPSKADDGDSGTPRCHVKREHPSKGDDGDSGTPRSGNRLRLEITKITEKGGLIDTALVEKLVELIKPRVDRKLDLGVRSMVSGVIAATDRCDCLSQFVQLKGLSVLDEWLQDINKGRLREDDDKSVEEFLFVLLRALDKLPVNLHALQTCNIGRSVNHLRSHKNMEIQRKARSLVDIWKKRVEVEMNVIDSSKSCSPRAWPSKSRDVPVKSSVSPPPSESKAASIKACSSPGPVKSASLTVAATEKEIKNRSVPNNNGTDLTSDSRFRAAGTVNISKMPIVGSRHHRKSVNNGFTETTLEPRRISLVHEDTTSHEKSSPKSVVISEKTFTRSVSDSGNHKLIVKIPNPSRSTSVMNCLVSPVSDQANVASSHVNIDSVHDEQMSKSVDESSRKSSEEGSRTPPSSSMAKEDLKVVVEKKKLRQASSSSAAMDALIESCAKYSEESASTSPVEEDDVGMNLLASVATREEENFLVDEGSMSKTCPTDNITAPCVLSREETHQSKDIVGSCSDLPQGMNVIDEKSCNNGFSCVSEESKKGLGGEEVPGFPDTDNGKKVEKSTSSELGEKAESNRALIIPDVCRFPDTDNGKKVEKSTSSASVEKVESNRALIVPDGEILQLDEIDAKKDEKLKTSNLSGDDELEKKDLSAVPEGDLKLDFDLNEALLGDDDGSYDEPSISGGSLFTSYPGSIPLASSPAKGNNFVPPVVDQVRTNIGGDTGWKGSAATSAFRPAEPRKVTEHHQQRPFDIDLNVADDENVLEDMATTSQRSVDHVKIQQNSRNEFNGLFSSPRGMDLDLNRVDDVIIPKPSLLFPPHANGDVIKRGFDLNNGPGFDDGVVVEQQQLQQQQQPQSSLNQLFMRSHSNLSSSSSSSPFSGLLLRPNGGGIIHHPNPYSSLLPTTMVGPPPQPQRILTSSNGNNNNHHNNHPFMSDMYRAGGGVVLPSSPYQMFPFGGPTTTFPSNNHPSGAFSAVGSSSSTTVNPHFLASSQYPKPFVIGQPFMTGGGGLDLNSGPGFMDVENRGEGFMSPPPPPPQRQLFASIGGSNTRGGVVEDQGQGRTYSITGGAAIKRKEPEGGLDRENLRYKQPSWH